MSGHGGWGYRATVGCSSSVQPWGGVSDVALALALVLCRRRTAAMVAMHTSNVASALCRRGTAAAGATYDHGGSGSDMALALVLCRRGMVVTGAMYSHGGSASDTVLVLCHRGMVVAGATYSHRGRGTEGGDVEVGHGPCVGDMVVSRPWR
jgi:hypothetical protein